MKQTNNILKKSESNHLKSIIKKRVSKKNDAFTIFSCLTSPIEANKIEKDNNQRLQVNIPNNDKIKKDFAKRFSQLKKCWFKRELVKEGKIQELVDLYRYFAEDLPKSLKIYATEGVIEKKKGKKPRKYSKPPKKYHLYIKSIFWENRKNKYYQKYPRKCVICGSVKNIGLHHLKYEDLGNEKDVDLVAVCNECHKGFHEEYGTKKDSHIDFATFASSKTNNPTIT